MNKIFTGALLTVLLTAGTSMAIDSVASADDHALDEERAPIEGQEERPEKPGDLEFSKVDLENGVQITITGTEAETIEDIQYRALNEEHGKSPFADEVNKEVELLNNGARITLTSEDEDVVEKLQNLAEGGPRGGHSEGEGHHEHADRFREYVDHQVTLTDDGFQVKVTSDDPDVVERLQERVGEEAPRGPRGGSGLEDVEHTVEAIENGILITVRSDNPDTVAELQEHAEKGPRGPQGEEGEDRPVNEELDA